MSRKPKQYKVIENGKEIISLLIPGRYAGNKPGKIFGRLDCKSGMRMKKENCVFFLNWADAIDAGYQPCKKCKPKPWDRYPKQEKLLDKLEAQPHISLWKTDPVPYRRQPNRCWYACLNWEERVNGKKMGCQVNLSVWFVYQRARSVAIALGQKYNLPVLEHDPLYATVLWVPEKRTNDIDAARDRKRLKELQKRKKVTQPPSVFEKGE